MQKQDIYNRYIETSFSNYKGKSCSKLNYFKKNYIQYLPGEKTAKILDIGCGRGEFLRLLKENGHTNFLGVDIGKELIEYCRKRVTVNVKLINNLQSFLKENQETYDLIVIFDVIEHFNKDDIFELVPLLKNSLAVGGTLIIQTINQANVFGLLHRYNDFTHEVGFNEFSLAQLAKLAGFSEYNIYPLKIPTTSMPRLIQICLRKIWYAIVKLLHRIEGTLKPKVITPVIYMVCRK